jgi:hypothetical protein
MPENSTLAVFLFAAILLLLALTGGGFKLWGGEISEPVGRLVRVVAGALGMGLLFLFLFLILPGRGVNVRAEQPDDRSSPRIELSSPEPLRAPSGSTTQRNVDLAGTWEGQARSLDEDFPLFYLALRATADGTVDEWNSTWKGSQFDEERPVAGVLTATEVKLQGEKPLYTWVLEGQRIEVVNQNSIRIGGTITIEKRKEFVGSGADRRGQLRAVLTLAREPQIR